MLEGGEASPYPKGKGDPNRLSAYRSMSLLDATGKLFKQLLRQSLMVSDVHQVSVHHQERSINDWSNKKSGRLLSGTRQILPCRVTYRAAGETRRQECFQLDQVSVYLGGAQRWLRDSSLPGSGDRGLPEKHTDNVRL